MLGRQHSPTNTLPLHSTQQSGCGMLSAIAESRKQPGQRRAERGQLREEQSLPAWCISVSEAV